MSVRVQNSSRSAGFINDRRTQRLLVIASSGKTFNDCCSWFNG